MNEDQYRPFPNLSDDQVRSALATYFDGTRGGDTVENLLDRFLDEAAMAMPPVYQQGNGESANFIRMGKDAMAHTTIDVSRFIANGEPVGPGGIHGVSMLPAGEKLDLCALIEQHSRVIQAGVRPIWATPRNKAIVISGQKTDGLMGLYEDAQLLRVTDPAPFAVFDDGEDVTFSPVPNQDAKFTWPEVATAAAGFKVSREDNRNLGGGSYLRRAILESMVKGVGLYLDRVFLAALASTKPATFSLGGAAAQYVKFEHLRGLVGTGATAGATVRQDGVLTLAGIPAEFTAASAASYVADWSAGGIAIWPVIDLIAKRTGLDGSMEITVHVNAQSVIARPGSFFEVA